MSFEVVLSVKNVSKRYEIYDSPSKRLWQMLCAGHHNFFHEFWALRDISFDIRQGESWGVIGRNGAGKSTLLKIITGTLQATTGRVVRHGKIAALLELGSGFNPEFTGRENVYMNASILGLSRAEIDERYREIVEFADIGRFIDQPVKKYSSGMKVRLAFAVQIMVEPDVLIVDEALAVGDMFFQQKCMNHLRKLQERGCTLFFVSHSLASVRSLCSKAVYLEHGRMKMVGPAKEVCDNYAMNLAGKENKQLPESSARTGAKAVRVQTTAVLAQSAGVSLFWVDPEFDRRVTERRGSGQIRYTAVDFFDEHGKRIQIAECGQLIRLVVSFKVVADVPAGTVVGFGCRDKLGNQLISMNTHTFGRSLPSLKAGMTCAIEYSLCLPLNSGAYFWSVGAQPDPDASEFYDYCLGAALLTVVKDKTNYSRYQWGRFLLRPTGIVLSDGLKREVLLGK